MDLSKILKNHSLYLQISTYIIIFILLFSSTSKSRNRFCDIFIENSENLRIALRIEIAASEQSMLKGLMFRKFLPENEGMLFIFRNEKKRNFWMKNTFIPLSIAYVDKHGVINEIYHMKPNDSSITYPSKYPAMYALEVNRGWFNKNKITKGNKIIFNGCFGK